MNCKEFVTALKSRVNQMSEERQLIFGINICEKLLSDYISFFEKENWGNPQILIQAIDSVKNSEYENLNKEKCNELLLKIDKVTPDTEDFDSCSYALNACEAAHSLVLFAITRKTKYIVNIGIAYYDNVDSKILDNEMINEDEIEHHLDMIKAIQFLLENS